MQHREGLYQKYEVYRSAGGDSISPGKRVDGCFVLKPREDAAALAAIIHYAELTPDDKLRDDLYAWAWDINNVPQS